MKKQIALIFSLFALAAFLLVNVAYAQSPKTAAKDVKVEKVAESKAPCTHDKADAKAHSDCGSKAEAAKKDCSSEAQKKCGGCPSKAAAKPAEVAPVPKK